MNFDELARFLQRIPDAVIDDAADIVAETATEYFKESFTRKGFDGNPWEPARHPKSTGSLLVDSGALVNSIRPSAITPERVVISAGNDKVTYARAHNEGYAGPVSVRAHTRTQHGKPVNVRAHQRIISVIKRQFMGEADELAQLIYDRLTAHIDTTINH